MALAGPELRTASTVLVLPYADGSGPTELLISTNGGVGCSGLGGLKFKTLRGSGGGGVQPDASILGKINR